MMRMVLLPTCIEPNVGAGFIVEIINRCATILQANMEVFTSKSYRKLTNPTPM